MILPSMAEERYREYPHHGRPEDHPSRESPRGPSQHYAAPPPPYPPRGEPERRSSMTTPTPASLPPMSEGHSSGGYGLPSLAPPPGSHGYPTDPRYASPQTTNGYPPPHMASYPPPQNGYDPRSGGYPPQDPYATSRPPPPPGYPSEHHHQQAPQQGPPPPPSQQGAVQQPPPPGGQQTEYVFRQSALQPLVQYTAPPPNGYTYQQYPVEYAHTQGPAIPQAAPRQRTSIACKYCRKRKIRCSGYQSAPGGKCQNCARMNQECVFQPVSSSSSTAFIPVSAVPGGVPPGTPLFGAYGQPLAPQGHGYGPSSQPQQPVPGPAYLHYQPPVSQAPAPQPQHAQPPPPQQHPSPATHSHHQPTPPRHQQPHAAHATHSPVESSYSQTSRGDDGSQTSRSRRRRRSSDDEDERRLPPPRVGAAEDEPRRRSPAEHSNNSSPSIGNFPSYSRHSPRNTSSNAFSPGASTTFSVHSNGTLPAISDGRSPVLANGSSGSMPPIYAQPPPNSQPAPAAQPGGPGRVASPTGPPPSTNVMSLSNLVEANDIDRGMINRLNQSRHPKP